MNGEAADQGADEAGRDSRKFQIYAWCWRVATLILIVLYALDIISEKVIFVILTYMSGAALSISNESKSEAAKARKASYENP